MKKIYPLIVALLLTAFWGNSTMAVCGPGSSEIKVDITADNYPQETSWELRSYPADSLLVSGTINDTVVCVPSGMCLKFNIHDDAGDGICCGFGNGSYVLLVNGLQVATGGNFDYDEAVYLNCPQGVACSNTLTAVEDTMTAPFPNTWYTFVVDSSGTWEISTCALGNTCDPIIYVYNYCQGLITGEGNVGTEYYNDDACPNNQTLITAALQAGQTFYIRVGDYQTSCNNNTINWQIKFLGPIAGCTDTLSCNYNPLATISDNSCVYAPSPLCPAPDLMVVGPAIENSMAMANLQYNNGCFVGEGCLAGYGTRRIMRFTTHIKNVGDQDYYIGAPDTIGNQFLFDPCHGHWHYAGYAEYLLFDEWNNQMQVGFKNGFCVLDLECSGGGQAKYGCGNMGITAGCGDIYGAGLDCQWVDLTDVDTGNYTLVVRVNWDHSPDKLGHYESTYDNNWAQVCFNLYYDTAGNKVFTPIQLCEPFVDCAGDTFGNARPDCAGTCNGSSVRGDVNANLAANETDVDLYLDGVTNQTLAVSTCLDLNGDGQITVSDAAKLNGCLRFEDTTHTHPGGVVNNHKHCEFPFNIINQFDTVTISIADTNLVNHYVDLSILSPLDLVLAYELTMHGLKVDSVKNLAVGNYQPELHSNPNGKIVGIARDENSLFKQFAPLNFLRVYFDTLTDSMICIEEIKVIVNSNYEEVSPVIGGTCFHVAKAAPVDTTNIGISEVEALQITVVPNPSNGVFEIYHANKSLYGADIRVYNSVGQVVYNVQSFNGLSNSFKLDLQGAADGMYLLQISQANRVSTKRLMIQRQ
jgi:hypothetical protein